MVDIPGTQTAADALSRRADDPHTSHKLVGNACETSEPQHCWLRQEKAPTRSWQQVSLLTVSWSPVMEASWSPGATDGTVTPFPVDNNEQRGKQRLSDEGDKIVHK